MADACAGSSPLFDLFSTLSSSPPALPGGPSGSPYNSLVLLKVLSFFKRKGFFLPLSLALSLRLWVSVKHLETILTIRKRKKKAMSLFFCSRKAVQ